MELRGICLFLALFLVSTALQSTEARTHSLQRRDAAPDPGDEANYDDAQNDAAADDDTQNDADNGDEEDEDVDAVITNKGEDFHVSIGKNLRLPCIIRPSPMENPAVVFQWLKDSTPYFIGTNKLSAPSRFSFDLETYDYLLINDLQPEDTGKYRCEVIKNENHDNEAPVYIEHTVRVEAAPLILDVSATNRGLVNEGADVTITCNVSGSPPPKLIWSREGPYGENHALTEKDGEYSANSVTIKNISREEAGKYLCYADNNVGKPAVGSVSVKVLGKPRVHVHKTTVNSDINVEAVLECSAHEEPPAHIRWYKDGSLIEDSAERFTVSTSGQRSTLSVTPTDDRDFGVFTCEAENDFGNHNRSIELVRSPVIEDLDIEGPKLTWRVHSHQPLELVELQLRDLSGNGFEKTLSVPLPKQKNHEYEMIYIVNEKEIHPGKYEALVNVKNNVDWNKGVKAAVIDIGSQPELIQGASVYRGSNDAHSIQPATALLATIFTYLFVRLL